MRTAETGDDSCRSWESQTDWYYSVVLYPFRIQTTLDPFATRWRWWKWRLKQHHRRRQPTGTPPPVSGRWDPEECWFRSERIRIKPVSHRPPSGSGSNTGRSTTKWTSAPKPPSVASKFSVQWGFLSFFFFFWQKFHSPYQDDYKYLKGIVNGRVALVPRSNEIQPKEMH